MIENISVRDIKDFNIGHYTNSEAMTGTTVIYFPNGANVGVDISGGGPANREVTLASPVTAPNPLNAIVLSGGSAYGLAAADGVMKCLEEHGIGYDTGVAKVPLVVQSCIYDLSYGQSNVRPDSDYGYAACKAALDGTSDAQGNIGAGTGATVGKLCGMTRAEKSGLGIASVKSGDFNMTAIVVVNALGDIFDAETAEKIAGLKDEKREEYVSSVKTMYEMMEPKDLFTGNTTIGAVITNADFDKAELTKIASMTRSAYARCINPVGTMADGDSIYAASTRCKAGSKVVKVDINFAGTLAAELMSRAIKSAVDNSKISDEEYLKHFS